LEIENSWARGIEATRDYGIVESGVQFPAGPPKFIYSGICLTRAGKKRSPVPNLFWCGGRGLEKKCVHREFFPGLAFPPLLSCPVANAKRSATGVSSPQFTYFALRKPPPKQIGTRFARALSPFGQPLLSKGLGRLWIFCLSGPTSYPKNRGCRNLIYSNSETIKYQRIICFRYFTV